MKIKKGDTVIVSVGKDKGKKGKVEKVFPPSGTVIVSGVNLYKRHLKRRSDKDPGGIVDLPRPLAVSKVALVCPACGVPTRVGYLLGGNSKERVCRKCHKKI